jgi:hypothetical protein
MNHVNNVIAEDHTSRTEHMAMHTGAAFERSIETTIHHKRGEGAEEERLNGLEDE